MKTDQLFNPSGKQRSAPKRVTTKDRNIRRKEKARIKAARAEQAQNEATAAMGHEEHLKGGIMRDIEKMYGKRFTRAAGNTAYVLEQVMLFNTARDSR